MARRFNRKPLTDAERDARRKADRERIEQAARALLTTDGWQRWIKRQRQQRPLQVLAQQPVADRDRVPRPRHHPDLRRRLPRLPGSQPLRAQGPEGDPHPRAGHRQAARRPTARRPARRKTFFRTVPVFDVSMTDPLPGTEPVPLTPPSQPITGDSHAPPDRPADRARRAARLQRRDPRPPGRRPGRLVRPQAQADRRRHRPGQPAGPHARARARPRARRSATNYGRERGRGPRRLRDLHRLLLGRRSTSAASRSPTSPAGARTARSTPSATTPPRSTRSRAASKTRSQPAAGTVGDRRADPLAAIGARSAGGCTRPDDRAGPAGAPAVRQRARAIAGRPRPGRGSCSPRPRPRRPTSPRRRSRALPTPPPPPPPRRRARRQRPARTDRGRLPDRLGHPAANPARPPRDLRLAARRRHPRGLPPLSDRAPRDAARQPRRRPSRRRRPSSPTRTRSTTRSRRSRRSEPWQHSPRQRDDLTLKLAGYTYEEIRILTGGRTFTNVNKSLVKARRRIRRSRSQAG